MKNSYMYLIFLFLFLLFPAPVDAFVFNQVPTRVVIPSVRISLPVSTAKITYNTWGVSNIGASFGESTALPGTAGNTVIFGHSMPHLFGNLPNIKKGDAIHLFTNDDWFIYIVTETKTVSPENIDALSKKNEYELTLYTCVGKNYSERFVVKALLASTIPDTVSPPQH